MTEKFTDEDDAMLAALGVDPNFIPGTTSVRGTDENPFIGVYKEIQQFYRENGRMPETGSDVNENILAIRLKKIRESGKYPDLLETLNNQGILPPDSKTSFDTEWINNLSDDELLAELGVDDSSITNLKFVRSAEERKATERKTATHIARRDKCSDFEKFKPLFNKIHNELKTNLRKTRMFGKDISIEQGQFFIVNGQIAYIAEKSKVFTDNHKQKDARLRVIYDNGTENRQLMRTLHKTLNGDVAGRRITEPDITALPMFSNQGDDDGDKTSGNIYVLRSTSNRPEIAENRDMTHKIGVTGGNVKNRIANAKKDPTFLFADVEILNIYKLQATGQQKIDPSKLEKMIHRIFESAQINIKITGPFGHTHHPREWFNAPYSVINEAIEKIGEAIKNGDMIDFTYDPITRQLQNNNIDDSPEPG